MITITRDLEQLEPYMSTRVTERKLKENLSDFLDLAETGEECVIRRRGRDSVVLVSATKWYERRLGRRPRLGSSNLMHTNDDRSTH
ncbi:MAG: type II toxin-antitoxin system prevent-host-death family antitoxin [Planctomycetaceae bacterium]|nr:type II toxin-antitoxin system prevent-host-death family antitoxin [Planctomycetaceae bacterium]